MTWVLSRGSRRVRPTRVKVRARSLQGPVLAACIASSRSPGCRPGVPARSARGSDAASISRDAWNRPGSQPVSTPAFPICWRRRGLMYRVPDPRAAGSMASGALGRVIYRDDERQLPSEYVDKPEGRSASSAWNSDAAQDPGATSITVYFSSACSTRS
jgi:hypothetical protein